MAIRDRMESCPVRREAPDGFRLSEVDVRLAKPEERPLWDAAMDAHHYLGFRRLASSGLRYVAAFGGRWLGLAARQNGAFKCGQRDRWCGSKPERQFRRLELIANNTRFLVLSEPGAFPNFASFFLARMTRRLADDWLAAHGPGVLLAETFCDPAMVSGLHAQGGGLGGLGQDSGVRPRQRALHRPPRQAEGDLRHAAGPDARALLSSPLPLPPEVAPPVGPGLVPRPPGRCGRTTPN